MDIENNSKSELTGSGTQTQTVRKPELIFASHPSAFSTLVLSRLLACEDLRVSACVHSTIIKKRGRSWLVDVLYLLLGSGLRYALYLWWVSNIFEFIAWMLGKERDASLCRRNLIPIIKTNDIHASEIIQEIKKIRANKNDHAPIYFVTCFFNQLLPAELLAIEGVEFINLHPGELPKYRGVDPVLEAMRAAEATVTTTLHITAEQLDSGRLLGQKSEPLNPGRSLFANTWRAYENGAELLCDWLQRNGSKHLEALESYPQQGKANYFGWPKSTRVWKIKTLFSIFRWRDLFVSQH